MLRALFVVLALVLSVPAAASAAETGLVIGGGAAAANDADAFATLQDTGSKWARHFLYWSDGEPAKGQYSEEYLRAYDQIVARETALGVKPLLVVTGSPGWASGSGDVNTPPRNPQDYADFVGMLARRYAGRVKQYEIWNEQDHDQFWRGGPEAAKYADLLRRSYAAIKAADGAASVSVGPLTGGNHAFMQQLYDNGAKGAFDAVTVHTDTACLTTGPTDFYRENGRIGQTSFLAYREVRQTMLANGDDKPIYVGMGWSASQQTCTRGTWAGQKKAGVTEAEQAAFLGQAYFCVAQDPYVPMAYWFNNRDPDASGGELSSYGLKRADGSARPAYDAFRRAGRGDFGFGGPCGDFTPPTVQILSPAPNAMFGDADTLTISATSPDKDVARMTFGVVGLNGEIRNFTNNGLPLDFTRSRPAIDWQGAKQLPFGRHTVVVVALDRNGNIGGTSVEVQKVNPATLPPQRTAIGKLRVRGSGRRRTLTGQVTSRLPFQIPGKVTAEWQNRRGGRWKKIHGGARNANKPFRFTQRLRYRGAWRVRAVYKGKRPFRRSASPWKRFRVR